MNIDEAIALLETVSPQAAREIQKRLEERPNRTWVDDLKEAAEIIDNHRAPTFANKQDDLDYANLANRLRLYACEIIGVNSLLDF